MVRLKHPDSFFPEIALFHFFAFYGIFSALSYDYHDNVVATMLVPWFMYYIDLNRLKAAAITAFLICIGKENMPLWLFFICLGLVLLYWTNNKTRSFLIVLALCILIYAVIIIKIVMPAFVKPGYEGAHFAYSILGTSLEEFVTNLFTKAKYIFSALFTNVSGANFYDGIKEETFICLFISGGIALLLKPEYIIMLIPVFAQKMYNNDMAKWGINGHYSIEFAPIVVIAFYSSLAYFKRSDAKLAIALFFCVICYSTTVIKMFQRTSHWYHQETVNIFSPTHYNSPYDQETVNKIISQIPDNARLSSANDFGPHVAMRKYIYLFPDIYDADYILVAESYSMGSWPLRGDELHAEIMRLKNSHEWGVVAEEDGVYLFKKATH
jgi:uncharacterized membrane protein